MAALAMPTEKALRAAQRKFERLETRTEEARVQRDALVDAALEAGWSHGRIARALGLSRGRVGQIASRRPEGDR